MAICGKELIYSMVIMLGSFTFGTVLGYPNPSKKYIYADHINVQKNEILFDLFNSSSSLFALFGPFFVNFFLTVFKGSRKKTIFIIALYCCALWYLLLLTKIHIWAGIVVRALMGIGIGAYSSICPMFIVEIAPENSRGFFGCLNQIGIVIGLVFINAISPSLKSYMKLCYISGAFNALQAILIFFIPESPAAHIDEDNTTTDVNSKNGSNFDDNIDSKESLFQKKYAFGLMVGIVLMFVQQFCGCNSILTNLSDLMSQAGLSIDPDYQSVIAQLAQLVAVFVGSAFMDLLGRRIVWIISSAIIIIFLLVYILYIKFEWKNKALPLVCIFFYEFGFGVGMGPIPWFIIPEYFNDDVRPMATTIVSSSNWIFSFIVIVTFPSMRDSGMHLWGVMTFYLVVTVIGLIFGLFCISEPNSKKSDEDNVN